jgi:membrane fusion protein (multidrug efflux system)
MSNPAPPRRRRWLVLVLVILALASGTVWAVLFLRYRLTHSISKDAFVESHLINVAPQVAGTVVEMLVQEQERVRKGQLLAVVDPSTYQQEVDRASARLAVAEAALQKARADLAVLIEEVPRRVTIAQMKQAIAREDEVKAEQSLLLTTRDVEEGITAAQKAVERAQAVLLLAEEDEKRYSGLYKEGSVTQRRSQEATRTYDTARADVRIAEARLGQAEATRKQIVIAQQQLKSTRHAVAEARAAVELAQVGDAQIEASRKLVSERTEAVSEARRTLELARTNLRFTRVLAPCDGIVAHKYRYLGDYAHVGDVIFTVYNPELLYVTVQLPETVLEGVAPGNFADLSVDAFRRPFRGRVIWVGSATSANFSLLPRDISSGEFTYVVQRVPTRIAIERDERWSSLRPGLSVTVTIEHGPGDLEWAREALRREAEIEGVPEKQP